MNLDQVTLQLLLIFFPGVLCAYIVDTFTGQPKASQFRFILNTFLFGVASYFLYTLALLLCGTPLSEFRYIASLSGAAVDAELIYEIASVCCIAVLLGLASVAISTHQLHYLLLWKLRITKRFGEEDVWSFFFNMPSTRWVSVRDLKNNLVYQGLVAAFSERYTDSELLLEQVSVYEWDTGVHLYDVEMQYLSLEKGSIAIDAVSSGEPVKELQDGEP